MTHVDVAERVASNRADLTPVDRRIADVLLARPEAVAFGTVASVAAESSASTAGVVRFAVRLGYSGFTALQPRAAAAAALSPTPQPVPAGC